MMIGYNDRVFIAGQTGTGKTTLAKVIASHFRSLVVYDDKHRFWLDGCLVTSDANDVIKRPNMRIIFRPPAGIGEGDDLFNQICGIVLAQGNTMLLVDEAAFHARGKIQPYHYSIMAMGRELGVGCINITQRPRGISNVLISEAEHVIAFRLNLTTDIDKLRPALGQMADTLPQLPDYESLYWSVGMSAPIHLSPVTPL